MGEERQATLLGDEKDFALSGRRSLHVQEMGVDETPIELLKCLFFEVDIVLQ